MNIGNLELKKYKNYKELCNTLEEKIKDGKSKKLQLEDWKRYFDWEKEGNGFIITEIYSTQKEKIDNRGKNKNSHKHSTSSYEELEYILLNYINHFKDTIYVSNNILAAETITNNNYYFAMKNEKYFNIYLKKIERLSNNTITKDLFNNINTSCKGIIKTSLEKLHKKYKLNYSYNYILIQLVEDTNAKIIDKTRMATTEEIKIIDATTKEYISKFNKEHNKKIKNLNDVCYLTEKLYREFYDGLNTEVFESLYNNDKTEIKFYFKGYIIETLNNIDKILKDKDIKELKENLNKKFIKNSIKNISRKIEKKKYEINEYVDDKAEKYDVWGSLVTNKIRYKISKNKFSYKDLLMLNDKYKNEYIDILNFILDIKTKDITTEIRKIINEVKSKYKDK